MELHSAVNSFRTAAMTTTVSTKKPRAVIHMRENSLDELEALFDPKKWHKVPPLQKRNLPASFFRPPTRQKSLLASLHVRQLSMVNSTNTDMLQHQTSFQHQMQQQQQQQQYNRHQHESLVVPVTGSGSAGGPPLPHHLRSISEPVSMIETTLNGSPNHISRDFSTNGWQSGKTNDEKVL